MNKVLIEFRHGLGDAVQLTSVLRHLKEFRPDWVIDVAALRGKHSAIGPDLANKVFVLEDGGIDRTEYNKVFRLDWHESDKTYPGIPSSKAERCLKEVFGVEPRADLCRYQVHVGDKARLAAEEYFTAIGCKRIEDGRFNAVLLHYQGNTSTNNKDLSHDDARAVCETAISNGYVPVILDWDFRSPLPDGKRIHCPDKNHSLWNGRQTGDAEQITAMISAASLMVGIDSGPQKCAAATHTPTLAIWTGHNPCRYYCFALNVTHLVRDGHGVPEEYAPKFFKDLLSVLLPEVVSVIGGKVPGGFIKDMPARATAVPTIPGRWMYTRLGHDQRVLELLANGRIGEGSADRERVWKIEGTPSGQVVTIYGDHGGPTFHAAPFLDGVLRGQWLCCEMMPVELRPVESEKKTVVKCDKSNPSDFIVGIPTLNRYDLLPGCIRSILESSVQPKKIVIIDNGGGWEGFDSPLIEVIRPGTNLGVAASWNLILKRSLPIQTIIASDDIVFGKNTLQKMLECEADFVVADESSAFTAFLVRQSCWDDVGEFDEEFRVAYCEDNDYAWRLNLTGRKLICPSSDGHRNLGPSATRAAMSPQDRAAIDHQAAANRARYTHKWGGPPHQERFATPFNAPKFTSTKFAILTACGRPSMWKRVRENLEKRMVEYGNLAWVPIVGDTDHLAHPALAGTWISPICSTKTEGSLAKSWVDGHGCYRKMNFAIEQGLDPQTYYIQHHDDCLYEPMIFNKVSEAKKEIAIISAHRGNNSNGGHGTSRLVASPHNMRHGHIDANQFAIRGDFLAGLRWCPFTNDADGVMAEYLHRYHENRIEYFSDAHVLFNALEPGRWNALPEGV